MITYHCIAKPHSGFFDVLNVLSVQSMLVWCLNYKISGITGPSELVCAVATR